MDTLTPGRVTGVRRRFGRGGVSFLSEVCRVCCCFWFVRRGVVRSCVVAGAAGAGRRVAWRRSSSGMLVLAGLPAASVGVRRPAVRVRGWPGRVAGVVGAVRRVAPACGPPFFGAFLIAAARPLRRVPACGQQKLDRCGGTNREEYLSAKGDWQSAAMPTIKALTKPHTDAIGFGGSSHDTPRRKPAPVPIG